ncbi:hypothetical protein SSYM_2161 [Serratia symbiotica str. Tucson]|uniref:Uncharacterized protein n=2 Tax=Serratia symbiotica TaxID=138074 RepID=E9CNW5_9GAMM|nr:hypothetical protein SSYM_2161 [Serratia symbiotica str. Tucson]BBI92842.1 uncharacterized protein SSYIS1_27560 [Serratia symbiotica]
MRRIFTPPVRTFKISNCLNELACVSAVLKAAEIVFAGYATARECVAILVELYATQRGVDAFAKLVVLRPYVDDSVNVATRVRAAISLNQDRVVSINDSWAGFIGRGKKLVTGVALVFGFFIAIVQADF